MSGFNLYTSNSISTLFSSVTTAIVLKQGASSEMFKYMAGSSANTIWLDIELL